MVLAISTVHADDAVDLNLSNINDAAIEIEEPGVGDLDVDALADKADGKDSGDAIEACFRRFGYNYGGWGYGYRCYRPYYSYRVCYPTYYCYRPVYYYNSCYPVVTYYRSYWGCY
jgi:hypothetical protein